MPYFKIALLHFATVTSCYVASQNEPKAVFDATKQEGTVAKLHRKGSKFGTSGEWAHPVAVVLSSIISIFPRGGCCILNDAPFVCVRVCLQNHGRRKELWHGQILVLFYH